jgi:hypothetical protein
LIKADYERKNLKAGLKFEYLTKGNYGIKDDYNKPFDLDWYEMTEPVKNSFIISGEMQLRLFNTLIMSKIGINI